MTPEHTDSAERPRKPTSAAEPAPCPWCGQEMEMWHNEDAEFGWYAAHLSSISDDCYVESDRYRTKAEAISAWNRVALAPGALKRLVEAVASSAEKARLITGSSLMTVELIQALEEARKCL